MSEQTNQAAKKKSGVIAIIGRSNVGKSTLINALIGQKIAIVTPKPQTTRDVTQGVYNDDRGQIVFLDTPGFFLAAKDTLSRTLLSRVAHSMKNVDAIIYLVDPTRPIGVEERRLSAMISDASVPVIHAMNKCDVPAFKRPYREDYLELNHNAKTHIDISALLGQHLSVLLDVAFAELFEGVPLFENGGIEKNPRHYAAEIIREKLFHTMSDEIPYGLGVEIEECKDTKKVLFIAATILTNTPRYKKMIIGHHGLKLKEMGTSARKELELFFQKKVYLELYVKTDERWMEKM